MKMSGLKQRLLLLELARLGFPDAQYSEANNLIRLNPSDSRMPKIYGNGDIQFGSEYDPLVRDELQPLVRKIDEIVAAWEQARAVPFENLSNYRVLAEYNGVVLAARDDSEQAYNDGLHFVTWRHDCDRTGFEHGNYTTDYDAAKEDFATRAGLVDRHKMMSETELKLIHQGLVFLGANAPDLSADAMTNVGKLIEKVEMIVPEIQERSVYEEHDLVAEDGLEV